MYLLILRRSEVDLQHRPEDPTARLYWLGHHPCWRDDSHIVREFLLQLFFLLELLFFVDGHSCRGCAIPNCMNIIVIMFRTCFVGLGNRFRCWVTWICYIFFVKSDEQSCMESCAKSNVSMIGMDRCSLVVPWVCRCLPIKFIKQTYNIFVICNQPVDVFCPKLVFSLTFLFVGVYFLMP